MAPKRSLRGVRHRRVDRDRGVGTRPPSPLPFSGARRHAPRGAAARGAATRPGAPPRAAGARGRATPAAQAPSRASSGARVRQPTTVNSASRADAVRDRARRYAAGATADVQNAQRVARVGMSLMHSGHGRVFTSTAGAG